jgi:hypothetical protein
VKSSPYPSAIKALQHFSHKSVVAAIVTKLYSSFAAFEEPGARIQESEDAGSNALIGHIRHMSPIKPVTP